MATKLSEIEDLAERVRGLQQDIANLSSASKLRISNGEWHEIAEVDDPAQIERMLAQLLVPKRTRLVAITKELAVFGIELDVCEDEKEESP